jgi:hypothetical protein
MTDIHFTYKLISCPHCCVMIWLTLSLYVCSSIRYVRILICCHKELLKSSLWSNFVTVIVWPLSLTVKYRKHHATLRPESIRMWLCIAQYRYHFRDPSTIIMEAACSSTVDTYPPNQFSPHHKRLQFESGPHPEFFTGAGGLTLRL